MDFVEPVVETAPPPSDEELKSVAMMAADVRVLESEIADAEALLKQKQAELARILEEDLPEAMNRIGMSEFVLSNSQRVTLKRIIAGAIPKDGFDKAEAWLVKTNNDGIVKYDISMKFGKKQKDLAIKLIKMIKENFPQMSPDQKKTIHHQTLQAFIREQIKLLGQEFPRDLFGVFDKTIAEITSLNGGDSNKAGPL